MKTISLLFLAACNASPGTHYTVYTQSPEVIAATDDWTQAVDDKSLLTFDVRSGDCIQDDHTICIYYVPHTQINSSGYTYRHEYADSSNVYIASDYSDKVRHQAIRHELGHAMGLVHDHEGTIMAKNPDIASDNITETDANQFRRLR